MITRLNLLGLGVIFFFGTIGTAHSQTAWKGEWEKTVRAAKKEGKIVIYMRAFHPILNVFKKEFPEIKPVTISGRGSVLGARIMAERRAKKYLVDIYIGGPHTVNVVLIPGKVLDPIPDKLILSEVVDESKWVTGKHRYTDPERKYNFAFQVSVGGGRLSYNTNLVNPKGFNSIRDLLNPKWRGRIVALAPTERQMGAVTQFIYYHPQLGPEFFNKLFGEMDITFSRDFRQLTDWLATGKFAICMGCNQLPRAIKQGLPVKEFQSSDWKEGGSFSTAGGSLGLINRAPHPNAAKVFLNWFLSRRGQIAFQTVGDPYQTLNSGRIDIPKDGVPPEDRIIEGRKYWDMSQPEWLNMEPVLKLAKDIMEASK